MMMWNVFITFLVALLVATAIAGGAYWERRKHEPMTRTAWPALAIMWAVIFLAIWIGGLIAVINYQ